MGLRLYVKIILASIFIMFSVKLFLWIFFPKATKIGQWDTLADGIVRIQKNTRSRLDNLFKDVLDNGTKDIHADPKRKSHIRLNPEVNRLLNVSFSPLKPPSSVDISFFLENRSLCEAANLTVVIMIHSAPSHFQHRKAIRETWANSRRSSYIAEVRTIFVLGRLKHWTTQMLVDKEFENYGDIIQGNFDESSRNLSLSSFYGFKWLGQNCANAKYVIKTDDDVVINLNKLFHAVNTKLMFVHGTKDVACFRVISVIQKEKESKNSLIGQNLVLKTNYTPPYCHGKFVLMTMDLLPDILDSASITPLFWLEDVYWYGIVMLNIPNVTYTKINWGDKIERNPEKARKCLKSKGKCKNFISWTKSADEIEDLFNLMTKDNSTYTAEDFKYATTPQDIYLL